MSLRTLLATLVLAAGLLACDSEEDGGGAGEGKKIAFERDNNIWVAKDDPLAPAEKQLTSDGNARTPALSPNGASVVFEHAGTELVTIPSGGGTSTVIATADAGKSFKSPFWAGSVVVFQISQTGQNDRVARVPENGGAITDLGEGRLPTLNAAANTLLLVVGAIGSESLATLPASGGSPSTLQGSRNQPRRAVFSPDGAKIAYSSDVSGKFKIFIADASGANPKQIQGTQGNEDWPAFSPSGNLLAFTSDEGGQVTIYEVPVDGSQPFETFLVGKTPSWGL